LKTCCVLGRLDKEKEHGYRFPRKRRHLSSVKEKTFIRYNEAFTNAEIDIKLNWHRYKEEYLRKVKG